MLRYSTCFPMSFEDAEPLFFGRNTCEEVRERRGWSLPKKRGSISSKFRDKGLAFLQHRMNFAEFMKRKTIPLRLAFKLNCAGFLCCSREQSCMVG